jgi:ATP-binding protein involved in chromosome partitioning
MSITKDGLRAALAKAMPAGSQVLWTSACDTYASCKLQAPGNARATSAAAYDAMGMLARQAAIAYAANEGTHLDSFIAEFVDDVGSVVHTSRFGGMVGAKAASPAGSPASSPAASPAASPASSQVAQGHAPLAGVGAKAVSTQGSLPGIKHIIAVGAGKGGVGKSTVSLNLAVGLARRGHSVGLLDADIYGPSMPTMLGLASLEAVVHQGQLQPFFTHGIKCMTIGKLVDADKPLIWRGPMAHGAFKQLTEQTNWGELDYLIIDLPPGTGDISLTMSQLLKLTGAVVVCTPQKVAQDDAVRAARMFQQMRIDILGVVENMSSFVGDDGKVYDIFGRGGAQTMAQRLNVPFLGEVPITMSLRANSDSGNPTANFAGSDPAGKRLVAALDALVSNIENQVALSSLRSGERTPTLTIS